MSYVVNEKQYLELVRQFLDSKIDGESFCRKFSSLWTADRDEEYAKHEEQAERQDLLLIEAHRRGEISPEEFEKRWVELFGYGEYRHLVEMLGGIFTACDVFVPSPEKEYEIDEAQLKSEVGARLADYEEAKAKPDL